MVAIVTGSSRGIGLEITKRLIKLGYKVYGIARNFDNEYSDSNYIKISCDLLKTEKLIQCLNDITDKEETVDLLVNNAGTGFFGPHEQLKIHDIQHMTRLNLEVPMILTNVLLRNIKKSRGTLIYISSVTAKKISTHGCAYSATKAGISHFAESLFEEVRKSGVKVTVIHPDMTNSNFYDDLDFTFEDVDGAYILTQQVADAVEFVLKNEVNIAVNDITIKPQINRIKRK